MSLIERVREIVRDAERVCNVNKTEMRKHIFEGLQELADEEKGALEELEADITTWRATTGGCTVGVTCDVCRGKQAACDYALDRLRELRGADDAQECPASK